MKLNSKLSKIKHIIHVSDIHIRLLKKHKEYRTIFKNLYNSIEQYDNTNTIVVITGDLVHNKTEMSPEMIDLVQEFITELSNRFEIVIIPGNHDINLNNPDRLDALSPIIKIIQRNSKNNIHYIKDSGYYCLANCGIKNYSVFENDIIIEDENFINQEYKIGLYHGIVQGSTSNSGIEFKNAKTTLADFDGNDIILLGDIHKFQTLQEYHTNNDNEKRPSVAYPSSLCQQNYGESENNHGYLLWNLENRNFDFIEIDNPYKYHTLHIANGELITDTANISSNPHIRLIVDDNITEKSQIRDISSQLKSQYNVQSLIINHAKQQIEQSGGIDNNIEQIKINSSDIKNVNIQNQLIKKFLEKKHNEITEEQFKAIEDLNIRINTLIKTNPIDSSSVVVIKYKKLEWSNMFTYGKDNVLDFTNFRDIYGLFAKNKEGKSATLEILLYVMFDQCNRANKAGDVINYNATTFDCKFNFEINNINYFIERHAKRAKNGKVSVEVDFYYINENNERKSLNGTERKDTNKIIRNYIGTFENLIMTSVSPQDKNLGLIDTKQAERKDLFASFLDITVFDLLLEIGNKENSKIILQIKELSARDFDKELEDINTILEENNKKHTELNDLKAINSNKKEAINNRILELTKQLIAIKTVKDINVLNSNTTALSTKKTNTNTNIETVNNNLNIYKNNAITLKTQIDQYDDVLINDNIKLITELTNKKQPLDKQLHTLTVEAKEKKLKIEKLKDLEYDKDCSFCMNNIYVKDAIQVRDSFEQDKLAGKTLLEQIQALDTQILELYTYQTQKTELDSLKQQLKQILDNDIPLCKSKIEKFNKEIELIELQIVENANDIVKYNQNIENIKANAIVESDIKTTKEELKTVTNEGQTIDNNIQTIIKDIAINENKITNINNDIIKLKTLEIQSKVYNYYLETVNRQGLPYELISNMIQFFENEINLILHQFTNFEIRVEMLDGDIDMYIDYGNGQKWLLELTSGFESFASSIAIRCALLNISNTPRPNGFIVDEGFGKADADNLSNIPQVFEYLSQYFEFILIVSHIDVMKDSVNSIIEITKDSENKSHINF
jgi:DNA repair exonuclease SbcCD ATPase subunit